ncbi:MAG: aminotransferase class I/II-fold pyridoxal phosphate-dependent enzyme [Limnochordales bacterium]|nr:aminotransferase class I/II-fold pyridoxal phosphate-dependent enzyme [Limnochordales bacterium]
MRLPEFRLERYFARYEFNVDHVLCASDCQSLAVGDLLDLAPGSRAALERLWLGYTEAPGAPALREAIARLYADIGPGDVLVHSGAQEAILVFMLAALEPGDHVIVHTPCYQSLRDVARALGCQVSPWQAREEAGWALDLDELKGLLRANTRVVVINTPHNPTGWLMSREDFEELYRITAQRGIILFSDEVYRGLEEDPARRLPAACELGPHGVSLGVLSKSYGLPGLRIGWVATRNRQVLRRMAAVKDYTTICNSAPSEFLAALALRHGETLLARSRALLAANRAHVDGFFARHPDWFRWVRPSAGPIGFPRLLAGDVEEFCRRLADEASVLLLPGTVYDVATPHFRLGLGRADLPQALSRLEEFLETL